MTRPFPNLLGPAAALTRVSSVVVRFCARHNSSEGHDPNLLGKLIVDNPFLFTPGAYATILAPDSENWAGFASPQTSMPVWACPSSNTVKAMPAGLGHRANFDGLAELLTRLRGEVR